MKKKANKTFRFLILLLIVIILSFPVKALCSETIEKAKKLGLDTLSSSTKIVQAIVENLPTGMETKYTPRALPLLLPQYIHFDTVDINGKKLLVIFYCNDGPSGKVSLLRENSGSYFLLWEEQIYCQSFPSLSLKDVTGDSVPDVFLRWVSGARPHENLKIYRIKGDFGKLISPPPKAGYENSFIGSTIEVKDTDGDGSQEIIVYQEAATSGPLYSVPGNEFTYKYDKIQERYVKVKVKRIEETK